MAKMMVNEVFAAVYGNSDQTGLIYSNKLITSPNTKVLRRFKDEFGYKKSELGCVSFAGIVTCFGRGACADTCYAYAQESFHYTTAQKAAINNTLLVANIFSVGDMVNLLTRSFDKLDVIRLNSDGDFPTTLFVYGLVEYAKLNPNKILYGYTKNYAMLVLAHKKYGQFPSNLRISLSVGYNVPDKYDKHGSKTWHGQGFESQIKYLQNAGFRTCHVVFDVNDLSYLPFNDEETQAVFYDSDFRILFHSKLYKKFGAISDEYYRNTGVHTC